MSKFYFRKACLSYELHLKYLRAAAKTKSKPRRRKLLSRAAKYLEKNRRELADPHTCLQIAKIVAAPLRKPIYLNSILNDIFQLTPIASPTFPLDLLLLETIFESGALSNHV